MFKEWFKKQGKVDDYILAKYNEKHKTNYGHAEFLTERILALATELGEFANETRCFKYWSDRRQGDFDKICKEFADILAFVPSIAKACGIDGKTAELYYLEKCDVNIERQEKGY
ncbi:dUTPase [Clostridium sp. UBA2485]|uniref:dUTPase n=1 Tax=Clostridium sp. UBA2485 TaxID=1946352 RepID=UPI0025B95742|nr:dUTPase [Clostridium sp. UBA2485]